MRSALALILLLASCADPVQEIIVEIDATEAVIPELEKINIEVLDDSGRPVDTAEVLLSSAPPNCLPFSFGIVPEDGENLPLTVRARATMRDNRLIQRSVATTFAEGTHYLLIEFPTACLDSDCSSETTIGGLPEVDREETMRRIDAQSCRQPPVMVGPQACVDDGGCFFEATDNDMCRLPCETPAPPATPEPPDEPYATAMPRLDFVPAVPTTTCPDGQAGFVSAPACAEIGDACPAGDYAENPPPGPQLTVDAQGDLQAALDSAAEGTVILLGRGTFAGPFTISRRLSVVGACAAATSVSGGLALDASGVYLAGVRTARVTAAGGEAVLYGVEINDGGLAVQNGANVNATELVIRDASLAAIDVVEGSLTATTVLINDSARVQTIGANSSVELHDAALIRINGEGATARDGASLLLDRALIEESRIYGLEARNGARLTIVRTTIRNTRPNSSNNFGSGIRAEGGSTVTSSRSLIERTRHSAVYANSDATFTGSDLVMRDIDVQASDSGQGEAFICSSRCTMDVSRVLIERASRIAIAVSANATFRDLTVTGTRDEHGQGAGLVVSGGGNVVVERAVFSGNPLASVRVLDADSSVMLRDFASADSGIGVDVEEGARLIIERATIDRARGAGVQVDTGERIHAAVELEDLVVRDTATEGSRDNGYGVAIGSPFGNADAHDPPTVVIRRGRFERNATAGIGFARCDVRLENVHVEGTVRGQATKEGGFGIAVTNGATVRGSRVALIDNTEAGVYVGLIFGTSILPSLADLSDVLIEGTTCSSDQLGCTYFRGAGAGTSQTGNLELRNFELRGNRSAGVLQYFVGEIDLFDGLIADHPIGAVIREENYDLSRLVRAVRYQNNAENISAIPGE